MEVIKKYDKEQQANGNAEGTRKNRIYFLMFLARELKKPFDSVKKDDINDWLADKKLKATTRNSYIEQIKHFFKWMNREKMVNLNS